MSRNTPGGANRRDFLQSASVLVAAAACAPGTDRAKPEAGTRPARVSSIRGPQLTALGETVLPTTLGAPGVRAAIDAFVAWCDGYEPVAEEMHGYGYADVRYLPSDPVPAWSAQLEGLEVLAQRVHHGSFATLAIKDRQTLVAMATRGVRGDRLPSPLAAGHVAVALMAHWASSPDAWDRAFGTKVSPTTCRMLNDATRKPLPIVGSTAVGRTPQAGT